MFSAVTYTESQSSLKDKDRTANGFGQKPPFSTAGNLKSPDLATHHQPGCAEIHGSRREAEQAGFVLIEQHLLADSHVAEAIEARCPCSAMFRGHPLGYRHEALVRGRFFTTG